MKTLEEIKKTLLTDEYLIEHGVDENTLYDEYYYDENGIYHYQRMFDKPMDEGGKPYTGIAWCSYGDCAKMSYSVYRDGYPCGEEVRFYPSGELGSYSSDDDEDPYYSLNWYENGVLKKILERPRKDEPEYCRTKEFDESGRLIKQTIHCEISYSYEPDAPRQGYEVTWHENGEFRTIKVTEPTDTTFYSEIELDDKGYPVYARINPHYSSEYLTAEKYADYWHIKEFDKSYRYEGGLLQYYREDLGRRLTYSGRLCFRSKEGRIEKIMEFKDGEQRGAQYLYYPSGKLREEYCISKGREYHRHLYWHPNGVLSKAVIYSRDKKHKRTVSFDIEGKVILERNEDI